MKFVDYIGQKNSPLPKKIENPKKVKNLENPKKLENPKIQKNTETEVLNLFLSSVYLNDHDLPVLKISSEKFDDTVALIDTGASRNFISYNFIKTHNLQHEVQEDSRPVRVTAANGENIRNLGTITLDINFKLPSEYYTGEIFTFFVLEKLQHKVILGVPFIRKHGNEIDWSGLCEEDEIEETEENSPEVIDDPIVEKIIKDNESDRESLTDYMSAEERLNPEEHNQLAINITSARQLKKQINNNDNYPIILFVQSLNENTVQEETNLEYPIPGTEEKRDEILREFKDIVTDETPSQLPPKRNMTHRILLVEPHKSNYRRQYKLSYEEKKELNKQVEELLKQGFIKPSASPFNSPVLFVKKKDGTLRMCIDYRLLNNNTIKDKFPLPRIDELTTCFGGAAVFSKLDLMSGYFQVRVDEKDMEKTAFSTDHGHYEWVVMPFGLTNAPSTFQRMMNQVLQPYINKFVQVYLDDIIIYSKSIKEHFQHLRKVLLLLRQNQLIAKKKKCSFYFKSLQFLGHIISEEGIRTDPFKIEKIKIWPTPKTIKEAQSFLGLSGYYRRFIKDYSRIAGPIMNFINKKDDWEAKQDEAFEQLKKCLINAPILIHPIWDEGYQFVVHTDACGSALGYVLEQLDPQGKLRGVVAYGSKKLIGSQLNYSIYDREFLAVVEALKTWRYYLLNRHFILKTDHHSLVFLKNQNLIDSTRVARWLDYLSQYDFSVEYIKGASNSVADALSRYPYATSANYISLAFNEIRSQLDPNEDLKQEIIKSYKKDEEFEEIYSILKNELPVPKEINNFIKHFSFKDDLLYYSTVKNVAGARIVIPNDSNIIHTLIKNAHEIPAAGHFGFLKTYERLNKIFYWPHMLKSVQRFCQRCLICQQSKPETTGKKGLFSPLPIPEGRWTDITLDFVTGIPESKKGYNMILVVIDRFTKMAHFIPTVKTLTAEGCARLMVDNCFKYHGIPKRMVSDKDIRFVNKFWDTIHKLFGTSVLFSTTNHPETDGQTERTNRILNQLLRIYTQNDIYAWDEWLSVAEFAYNSAYQVSIGTSPFELCLGYLPDSPAFINTGIDYNRYSNRAEEFADRMKLIMQQVKDNLVLAQHHQEVHHNQHRSTEVFEKGDLVLVHKDAYGINPQYYKIQPVYFGPYKVVKKVSDNAYEIDLPRTNRRDRVLNIRWLRKFLQATSKFPRVPPRTMAETRARLTEIIGIAGINRDKQSLDVYWRDCDPCHSSEVPFTLFDQLPQSIQDTLWQNAKIIELDPDPDPQPSGQI